MKNTRYLTATKVKDNNNWDSTLQFGQTLNNRRLFFPSLWFLIYKCKRIQLVFHIGLQNKPANKHPPGNVHSATSSCRKHCWLVSQLQHFQQLNNLCANLKVHLRRIILFICNICLYITAIFAQCVGVIADPAVKPLHWSDNAGALKLNRHFWQISKDISKGFIPKSCVKIIEKNLSLWKLFSVVGCWWHAWTYPYTLHKQTAAGNHRQGNKGRGHQHAHQQTPS